MPGTVLRPSTPITWEKPFPTNLFRVHCFRARECLVGVLDLWVVVGTTERGGCLGCSASVLLIRLPTLGRGATIISSTGYIIIEGAIALSLDRHRRACVNHLFQAGQDFEKSSKPFAAPSLVPCTGRYPSCDDQMEAASAIGPLSRRYDMKNLKILNQLTPLRM